jgi:hypothetical protein
MENVPIGKLLLLLLLLLLLTLLAFRLFVIKRGAGEVGVKPPSPEWLLKLEKMSRGEKSKSILKGAENILN